MSKNSIMNKLTLILQDKEIIAEIAKDESVKIRITDAIIDRIRKRSSKVMEGIAQDIANRLENQLYDKGMWSKSLSEKVRLEILKEASSIVSDIVRKETSTLHDQVFNELKELRSDMRKRIETMNIEPIIEKYVRIVVREKFNL